MLAEFPPGENWVRALEGWARLRGKPIHYFDNCWFRVPMDATELRDFVRGVRSGHEVWAVELLTRVRDDECYVVEAESF